MISIFRLEFQHYLYSWGSLSIFVTFLAGRLSGLLGLLNNQLIMVFYYQLSSTMPEAQAHRVEPMDIGLFLRDSDTLKRSKIVVGETIKVHGPSVWVVERKECL